MTGGEFLKRSFAAVLLPFATGFFAAFLTELPGVIGSTESADVAIVVGGITMLVALGLTALASHRIGKWVARPILVVLWPIPFFLAMGLGANAATDLLSISGASILGSMAGIVVLPMFLFISIGAFLAGAQLSQEKKIS